MLQTKKLQWKGKYKDLKAGVTGTGVMLYAPKEERYKKTTWNH